MDLDSFAEQWAFATCHENNVKRQSSTPTKVLPYFCRCPNIELSIGLQAPATEKIIILLLHINFYGFDTVIVVITSASLLHHAIQG